MKSIFILFLFISLTRLNGQVFLQEGFEGGTRPVGWTEENVYGTEPWRYRNGGHSPNDNNWLVPPEQIDITRNPPSAAEGNYNAIFFKQGDNNERTMLVTPELDLLGGSRVELSFYLCQIPWTFEGSTGWDVLRVYYKTSAEGPWILLNEYLDPVYDWELRSLVLPSLSSSCYIAFEGQTRWGYGTCIDDIRVAETEIQDLHVGTIEFSQPASTYVPAGSKDVPLMRIDLRTFGNTGSSTLQSVSFKSLNTNDADIVTNGLKLYAGSSQFFSRENPIGVPGNFISGVANFTGLNHDLPPGLSYVWLACDLDPAATHGDTIDIEVEANGIMADGAYYPAADQSPPGSDIILETLFKDDFEGVQNWTLSGEFEVASPNGSGGSPGNPDPSQAYSGTKVLGTDLTGTGSAPYNYEPGLDEASGYLATTQAVDAYYYTHLNIFFQRYLNVEVWDHASVEVSADDGGTWHNVWKNNSYISDFSWTREQIPIPDEYSRTHQLKVRYKLGPSDDKNNYSGWNIDDFFVTGEFISRDVGVSGWIYPLSGSGHSSMDSVTVSVRNYGGKPIITPVPVSCSLDGGASWITDSLRTGIPVGGAVTFTFPTKVDLSKPGLRPSVLAKTLFPGDQCTGNDAFSTSIYIVPTYLAPYYQDFDTGQDYWTSSGNAIWECGTPAGSTIHSAASGTRAWMTNLDGTYGEMISSRDRIIMEDHFETDNGWTLSGEYERNIPSNMYPPYFAYSGYYCLGTDLSGMGSQPYFYENNITPATAYTAVSPAIDVSSYTNLGVSFASWLMIRAGDSARFEVSPDNGSNWITLWKNTQGEILDQDYNFLQYDIDDSLSFSHELRFRFSLFYSSGTGAVAEGWNIDDFVLTGDLLNTDEAGLNSPSFDISGLQHPVFEANLWTDTEQGVDGADLAWSLDDGHSWTPVSDASVFDPYWNWYSGKYTAALGRDGWSGQSSGWKKVRHLLPAGLIGKKNVQFRLEFRADKFNNEHDGIALDNVRIYDAPYDIGVTDILSPVSSCELSENEKFRLRLKNFGLTDVQAGDTLKIGYFIDGAGIIQADTEQIILTGNFAAGTTRDFVMTKPFDFGTRGEYNTEVFTIEDDPFYYHGTSNDTLSRIIRVNKPSLELGPDISTLRPDTIRLFADDGGTGNTYLWQDGSVNPVYDVHVEGTYYVRVTNDLACVASDTVHILQLIADPGIDRLLTPASDCEIGSGIPVRISINNFGTDTLDTNDTLYITGMLNGTVHSVDTLQLTQKFYPGDSMAYTLSKLQDFVLPGSYRLKIFTRFRDDFNHLNDTLSQVIEVYGYPDVDLGPDTMVEASEYTLSPTPGYFEYLWQDGSAGETFTIHQPGNNSCSVAVVDDHGCAATDSVQVNLSVKDLSIDRILSPAPLCNPPDSLMVSVRLKNSGNLIIPSGEEILMGYAFDGDAPVRENIRLTEVFLPGTTMDFTFRNPDTLSTGKWYHLAVYLVYVGDMKASDDTLAMPVGIFDLPVVSLGEDYRVITGLQYNLDAGPGYTGYLWQDGSTQQTYHIGEPGIGTYTVTVTDEHGCTAFDKTKILLAVPDIGVSGVINPVTTCDPEGSGQVKIAIRNFGYMDLDASAKFSVSYSLNGGVPVTEQVVLDTSFEHGTVIYHTFSRTENITGIGHYEITANTYYDADLIPSNDTISVSADISEKPEFDLDNGQDTLRIFDPVTLSAGTGFSSFAWQDGSTSSEYEITSPGRGFYSVTVTAANGCIARDSVYVIFDRPDLSMVRIFGPMSSCGLKGKVLVIVEVKNSGFQAIEAGETIDFTYSVNSEPVISEPYSLENDLNPGQILRYYFETPYDFPGPGLYRLKITAGYERDIDPANNTLAGDINSWDDPHPDIGGGRDTLHTALPLVLEADPGYAFYFWQDGSTGQLMDVDHYGLYFIKVIDDHGCEASDSVFVDSPVYRENRQSPPDWISIFPNPVADALHIRFSQDREEDIILELYNVNNKLVYRKGLFAAPGSGVEIDTRQFVPGFYYLKIMCKGSGFVFRVIVL